MWCTKERRQDYHCVQRTKTPEKKSVSSFWLGQIQGEKEITRYPASASFSAVPYGRSDCWEMSSTEKLSGEGESSSLCTEALWLLCSGQCVCFVFPNAGFPYSSNFLNFPFQVTSSKTGNNFWHASFLFIFDFNFHCRLVLPHAERPS